MFTTFKLPPLKFSYCGEHQKNSDYPHLVDSAMVITGDNLWIKFIVITVIDDN